MEINTLRKTEKGQFFIYSSPQNPRLDELISVQMSNGNNEFSEPTFHILPRKKGHDFCQFLANVTGNKIRMTTPDSIMSDVSRFNGRYFSPVN